MRNAMAGAGPQGGAENPRRPFRAEDIAEMALLLSAGDTIEQLRTLLPAPVPSFHEQLLWQVREIYDRLATARPDVAPYVAVIVMNRLVRPWEALRLPLLVTPPY